MKQQQKQEIIFGAHPVKEAAQSGADIDKVLIQSGLKGSVLHELRQILIAGEIPFQIVPREKLDRLTRANHQGFIALMSPVSFQPLHEVIQRIHEKGEDPFIVVLDRVTDVRNFGAICRSAECVGVHAMLIPSSGSSRIGGDAVKTSAGALLRLPVCREKSLREALRYLKDSGVRLVACTEKASEYIYNGDLTGPIALLLGSEEDGINPEYLKMCDLKLKIPMKGSTGSLNVSVAGGIIMYEALRQSRMNNF